MYVERLINELPIPEGSHNAMYVVTPELQARPLWLGNRFANLDSGRLPKPWERMVNLAVISVKTWMQPETENMDPRLVQIAVHCLKSKAHLIVIPGTPSPLDKPFNPRAIPEKNWDYIPSTSGAYVFQKK